MVFAAGRRVPSPKCANRDSDDNDDDDETNNQLVIEEEPTLEIDESWYSEDDDDDVSTFYWQLFVYFAFIYENLRIRYESIKSIQNAVSLMNFPA